MSEEPFNKCLADMRAIAQSGCWTLEAQVRAYDLLEGLFDHVLNIPADFSAKFCTEYETLAPLLDAAYDESALREQALQGLVPLDRALAQAELRMSRMTDLHECAKLTFEIWQTKGLFARQRALRVLRSKAGFRLEPKRIGNYVAKTFDLMNEARIEYARAQQIRFTEDMTYKIRPGIYAELNKRLKVTI